MAGHSAQCNNCQARFEIISIEVENVKCPGCGSKNVDILEEIVDILEEIQDDTPGCGSCSGCPGCH